MTRKQVSLSTKLTHCGLGEVTSATEPLITPIYQTAVYKFDDLKLVDEVQDGTTMGYMYSRYGNPNLAQLEEAVAAAEAADAGVACASGMAAIFCAVLAFAGSGDHIVATQDLYGGTRTLFARDFSRIGIKTTFVDDGDINAVVKAFTKKTRILYVETLTNPTVKVADIPALAKAAHAAGVMLFVDNTFATPVLWRPIEQGADVVLHSVTKYLAGHSDVTAGVVVGSFHAMEKTREIAKSYGPTLDPFGAWLAVRGMRTLHLRVREASRNAQELARWLSAHQRVIKVHYPGLPCHPQHHLAQSFLNDGFGGMLSFEVDGGLPAAEKFFRTVRLCDFAPSLGDVSTLITHPVKTSHRSLTPEEKATSGITDGLIRVSTGIEDVKDIIADLEEALSS